MLDSLFIGAGGSDFLKSVTLPLSKEVHISRKFRSHVWIAINFSIVRFVFRCCVFVQVVDNFVCPFHKFKKKKSTQLRLNNPSKNVWWDGKSKISIQLNLEMLKFITAAMNLQADVFARSCYYNKSHISCHWKRIIIWISNYLFFDFVFPPMHSICKIISWWSLLPYLFIQLSHLV